MATITQTVEETLTFTAKPPQKQMKLKLLPPAIDSYEELKTQKNESYEEQKPVQLCPPDCKDCKRMMSQLCPPGCEECKKLKICSPSLTKSNFKTIPLVFNIIGIIIAVLASYLIVSTDSNLYLVFWIVYSVLRRMMTKSKSRVKTE